MKKVALVFVLAVFLPSLVLAWLAVRSLRDQQFVLERQQSLLYQSLADSVAKEAASLLAEHQREFARQVEAMLGENKATEVADSFDRRLRRDWRLADVGFAVSLDGQVYSPNVFDGTEAWRFRLENEKFLCSRESVQVYWNSPKGPINLSLADDPKAQNDAASGAQLPAANNPTLSGGAGKLSKDQKLLRNVEPQQVQQAMDNQAYSKVAPSEAEFRQLIGDSTEGTVARFLQNKLNLMFWYRSPRDPQLVFGALINLPHLAEALQRVVKIDTALLSDEICVALLDDHARPGVSSGAGDQLARVGDGLHLRERRELHRQPDARCTELVGAPLELTPDPVVDLVDDADLHPCRAESPRHLEQPVDLVLGPGLVGADRQPREIEARELAVGQRVGEPRERPTGGEMGADREHVRAQHRVAGVGGGRDLREHVRVRFDERRVIERRERQIRHDQASVCSDDRSRRFAWRFVPATSSPFAKGSFANAIHPRSRGIPAQS